MLVPDSDRSNYHYQSTKSTQPPPQLTRAACCPEDTSSCMPDTPRGDISIGDSHNLELTSMLLSWWLTPVSTLWAWAKMRQKGEGVSRSATSISKAVAQGREVQGLSHRME